MKKYLHIFIAFPLLLGATIWQGISSDRWGLGADVVKAAERLKEIPLIIETKDDSGKTVTWSGTDLEIPEKQLKGAEAVGYISRKYIPSNSSELDFQNKNSPIYVVVLCGRPGPISVHSPTVCFPGTGLVKQNDVEKYTVRDSGQSPLGDINWCEFATKEEKNIRHSLTLWTWSTENSIEVPDNPRKTFYSKGFLYKIYVRRERLVPPGESGDFSLEQNDLTVQFLRAFIPELKKALHNQESE